MGKTYEAKWFLKEMLKEDYLYILILFSAIPGIIFIWFNLPNYLIIPILFVSMFLRDLLISLKGLWKFAGD